MNNTQPSVMTQNNVMTPAQAQNAIILNKMYDVAFNKIPDAEGFAYWMNEMNNGKTIHDVAAMWQPFLPQFTQSTTHNVIDLFANNAFDHNATQDVHNHWGILAIHAVPSFELVYEMSVALVGQSTHDWANPVL